MQRLKGKIALITGSARGIGLAIAKLFAREGAKVLLSDIEDTLGKEALENIENALEYIHLDVSKEKDWISSFKTIKEKYKKIDILINNAGITGFSETKGSHNPEDLDMYSWHKVHEVNLNGVALGCKYAIKLMKESKLASIVNISSRSGIVGVPTASSYASSKAGVRNHTKSVALYCAEKKYSIRCNSIHPGAILTPMWDLVLGKGEKREEAIRKIAFDIPLGVMGDVDDVAYASLYLASDESKYVTGIELNVDGGILAGSVAKFSK